MGAEAAHADVLAAREVWKALGVPNRKDVIEENVEHSSWHPDFALVFETYLDKFFLGKENGPSTDILKSRYTDVDREK